MRPVGVSEYQKSSGSLTGTVTEMPASAASLAAAEAEHAPGPKAEFGQRLLACRVCKLAPMLRPIAGMVGVAGFEPATP